MRAEQSSTVAKKIKNAFLTAHVFGSIMVDMKNGETRKVGNAVIWCNVHRQTWTKRADRWMGRMAPRMSYSETFYMVTDAAGNVVQNGIKGYRNAVKVAEGVK